MKSKRFRWVLWSIGVVTMLAGWAGGGPVEVAIERAAHGLIGRQLAAGQEAGAWVGETEYTGTLVAGLVSAYEATGNPAALAAARLGGDYIVQRSGHYYGDEAFALCLLGEATGEPEWCGRVSGFYDWIRSAEGGGTQRYIDKYTQANPSIAVYYLAYHTLAACRVGAADRHLYRAGLIRHLGLVQDGTADYPVLALGVATWALAGSGPLDGTLVRPGAAGQSVWKGVTLAGLPLLLASHQVATGPQAGSFYWRFDHQGGAGYTEDTVYGVLGLTGALAVQGGAELPAAIAAARRVLPLAVKETAGGAGEVDEQIWSGGVTMHYYAGEALQALGAVALSGDIDDDNEVTVADLAALAAGWYREGCGWPGWCGGADLDYDGRVNLADFQRMTQRWGWSYR